MNNRTFRHEYAVTRRTGTRFAPELFLHLFEMTQVNVYIAKAVNELTWVQAGHLRDHHGQQGIGSDIERDPKEEIRASLIEVA